MYKKIVLAYDGTDANLQALIHGRDFAYHADSEFYLLAVVPYDSITMGHESAYFDLKPNQIEEDQCLKILNEGIAQLTEMNIFASGAVLKGHPVDQIVYYAKSIEAQLIIVGHKHREHWLQRWWRGTISKSLIENAHCSVLVSIVK